MIIVTSYRSPDLDGIACTIAYAELLRNKGEQVRATYYGELGLEVEFVRNYTRYFPVEKHEGAYEPEDRFVLVDTSDRGQ